MASLPIATVLVDLTTEPWTYTTKTTHLVETTYLDVPVPADLNVPKTFRVQVRDAFGNISDEANTNVQVNDVPPSGGFDYAGSSLTPTQYILSFDLNAIDPDPSDNVYWYSLVADDVLTTDWEETRKRKQYHLRNCDNTDAKNKHRSS